MTDRILDQLRALYLQAETDIINDINRLRTLGFADYHKVAALKRVQKILTEMQDKSHTYTRRLIDEYFYLQYPEKRVMQTTAEQAFMGYRNAEILSDDRVDIVEKLLYNVTVEIETASKTAYSSLYEMLIGRLEGDAYRKNALESVALSKAKGGAPNWNDLMARLRRDGITAFTDRAGRHWSLSAYCNMAVRTTGNQAQTLAALTADEKQDLYKITGGWVTCSLCAPYEGRVFSRSGDDPNFPPLASAFGKIDPNGGNELTNTYLNIHPNCRHRLTPWAAVTREEYEQERRFSSFTENPPTVDPRTEKQIEQYRAIQRSRARFRNDFKQFERYRETIPETTPKTFQTFLKHKQAGDEKYKAWEKAYREANSVKLGTPSEAFTEIKEACDASGIDYIPVKKLSKPLSEDEIVERLSGGDMTKGSCSSLAFAYIGNKGGLDVLDFRGGKSCDVFSKNKNIEKFLNLTGVDGTVTKVRKEVKETSEILKTLKLNEQYYLAAGKHAAIVRRVEDSVEYLELQHGVKEKNGWTSFGTISETLKRRFGCRVTEEKIAGFLITRPVFLMRVDSFRGNKEFERILGYINTATEKQMKGGLGGVK